MLENIKKYAKKNNIPIMEQEGLDYLLCYIKQNNIKNILEIGTAIGYSAINMALIEKDIKIITIEREEERYQQAIKNIKNLSLEEQITLINDDAFNVKLETQFDLIFIDAAKSQSKKLFERFEPNLSKNGTIITDNLYFHGLTFSDEKKSRNLRQLTRKIREYIDFLKDNNHFNTKIIDVGDGIAISTRSEK